MCNMLQRHVDPTFLHIYATAQATAISTSHVIAKHVPEQICPANWANMPNT